jgi:hypothetical protein
LVTQFVPPFSSAIVFALALWIADLVTQFEPPFSSVIFFALALWIAELVTQFELQFDAHTSSTTYVSRSDNHVYDALSRGSSHLEAGILTGRRLTTNDIPDLDALLLLADPMLPPATAADHISFMRSTMTYLPPRGRRVPETPT